MVNALDLLQQARALGANVTLQQVQQAIAAIDRATLEATERARYQVAIWDETSPLAGQPPEYWRSRGDWPQGGTVVLVYCDGNLLYVQPHDPDSAGIVPMDQTTATARANAIVDRLVTMAVDEQVRRQALIALLGG
ncbi:MAG: hypothetical protein IRY83_04145 [Chloroflexi bacterium]|nr:hypothetical protein [Chloroflexota bacterium]